MSGLADTVRKLQKDVATALRVAMNATGGGGLVPHTHQNDGEGGQLDHGAAAVAASLLDDDHTQYLKEKASGGTAAETPEHAHQAAASCGQLDHGAALTGLGDDDHTIYLLADATRDLTATWTVSQNIYIYKETYGAYLELRTAYAGASSGGYLYLSFSRGTKASPTVISSGDRFGAICFRGYDGDEFHVGAQIDAACDDTPGNNDMPGRLIFRTTANGASTPTEQMRIDNAGLVRIGSSGTMSELLNVEGRVALKETTDPTNTANYGKIWVRSSDSKLYFMDDSGNIYELTAAGTVSSENFFPRWDVRTWNAVSPGNAGWIATACTVYAVAPGAYSTILDANGKWGQDLSNAIAGNICHVRGESYDAFQPRHNPYGVFCLKTYSEITHVRLWVGFNTAAEPRSGTPNQDDVGFRFSTPDGDTNWMFQSRNAAGTTTVDTGVAVAASTVYVFKLWTSDGGTTWNWDINGTSGSNTNNVPSTTANHSPLVGWIPESAAADAFLVGYFYWMWDQG